MSAATEDANTPAPENPAPEEKGAAEASKPEENAESAGGDEKKNGTVEAKADDAAETAEEPTENKETKPEAPPKISVRSIVLSGHKLKQKQRELDENPSPGNVYVRVKVCGLNFFDLTFKQGLYKSPPKTPCVLGWECTGVVEKIGDGVENVAVGDRVIAMNGFGLWAELVSVPANQCFVMPDEMSFEEGAAIPVNYLTAHMMLFNFGNLRKGKSVLIHMAAGGVGVAATQLCKTVPDVTVFGTSSAPKHKMISEQGVTHPIDYRTKDYVEEIRNISPKGVDIVLDPLSGSDSAKGFNLLKPMGKIIHFGAANMVTGENRNLLKVAKTWWQCSNISPLSLMPQNKSVCGFHLGHMIHEVDLIREHMEELMQLYKEGKIKPVIDSVWPFEQVAGAMARMHERKNVGKILLSPEKAADEKVEVVDYVGEEKKVEEKTEEKPEVDESKDNTTEKEPETQPDEKAVKQEEVEIPEKKPEEAAQTIENAAEQQPTQG